MSDDSVEESIEESFEDFDEESVDGSHSKSLAATSKAQDSPPSGNGDSPEANNEKSSSDGYDDESFHLEESLAQTKSTSKSEVAPDESLDQSYSKASPKSSAAPGTNEESKHNVQPKPPSTPGSIRGSKETVATPVSKGGSKGGSKESATSTEPKAEAKAEEPISSAKVPRLALTERGPWLSAGGLSSAKDHLRRSSEARDFNLRYAYTERTVIVRDPSPTFGSARKIPRGLLKKMEEEKKQKEAEEGSSATSVSGSKELSSKSPRKHLLYTMPQRSTDACWGEANRAFRPYMRVKAEYVTPTGKKVTAFGQLLSGWEVPKSRLREGPHAKPPNGREPPSAKAVTALPLIEKERSEKYVRVMLHDGVEKLLPKSKVKNADPMDIFR